MQKKVFESINLTCMFQNTNTFGTSTPSTTDSKPSTVIQGMLSQNEAGGILFQETLPRLRENRNTKLFEGELVSIVRRKDGRYYPLVKALKADDLTDKSTLAFRIYSEISEALNVID